MQKNTGRALKEKVHEMSVKYKPNNYFTSLQNSYLTECHEKAFILSGNLSGTQVMEKLPENGYGTEAPVSLDLNQTYYDSYDGKYYKKNMRLFFDALYGKWIITGSKGVILEQEGVNERFPGDGEVAEKHKSAGNGRKIFPVLHVTGVEKSFTVSRESKPVVLLKIRELEYLKPGKPESKKVKTGEIITLEPADGSSKEHEYLATIIRDMFKLKTEDFDMLTRGLGLLGLSVPGMEIEKIIYLQKEDSINSLAAKIIEIQSYRMWANTEGTIHDLDAEYLHDLRVATRRLRFALRTLSGYLDYAKCTSLREELKWIAGLLGKVRDGDVFHAATINYMDEMNVEKGKHGIVSESIKKHYRPDRRLLEKALKSPRYRRLLEKLIIYALELKEKEAGDITLIQVARTLIHKSSLKILKYKKKSLEDLSDIELHAVRIAFKRLRYLCEFFSFLFGKKFNSNIKTFIKFQDCLGEFNDAVISIAHLEELAVKIKNSKKRSDDVLLVIGALIQLQQKKLEKNRQEFLKRWGKVPEIINNLTEIIDKR